MEIGGVGGVGGAGIGGVRPPRPARPDSIGAGTDAVGAAGVGGAGASGAAAGADFGQMLEDGIEAVGDAERSADDLAERFAVGDPGVQIQDVTVAAAEAGLSVQLMVAVRDRALEAYQQVVNLQV